MVCSSVAVPTRTEILQQEYTKCHTIDRLRENQNLANANSILSVYQEGKNQLAIAKRQSVVCSLYAPKVKSVMELNTPTI